MSLRYIHYVRADSIYSLTCPCARAHLCLASLRANSNFDEVSNEVKIDMTCYVIPRHSRVAAAPPAAALPRDYPRSREHGGGGCFIPAK